MASTSDEDERSENRRANEDVDVGCGAEQDGSIGAGTNRNGDENKPVVVGDRRWAIRFVELAAFRRAHGHCGVPKAHGVLGRWVARQRELRRAGKLAAERIQTLDSIGFTWSSNDTAWLVKYQQLKRLCEQKGCSFVRTTESELGTWVAKQRQLRRRDALSQDRRALLDQIGFVWDCLEVEWDEKVEQLKAWIYTNRHSRVPFTQGELGRWVHTQRQMLRRGKLSKERYQILTRVGFEWNPKALITSITMTPAQEQDQQQQHPQQEKNAEQPLLSSSPVASTNETRVSHDTEMTACETDTDTDCDDGADANRDDRRERRAAAAAGAAHVYWRVSDREAAAALCDLTGRIISKEPSFEHVSPSLSNLRSSSGDMCEQDFE
eukprot:CAMPEP_0185856648 /NCGR_PEP_ID=MMETSP1354-20130828/29106_1 /TAXON_ID=708628 /ORGANISM="Erythrolobus madagascarensis, Strain CCMP3276" /LENGTH=378 /DNA_ID=CAMNT_0028558909 /DNA_START=436 /DNA_END=1572 /DNA_ORIENTATION=-